jgi:hypothetical protein
MTDYVLIESGDADDAENVGALLGHPALVDYVLYGLEITNLDATNGEFDVTDGKAYIDVGDLATSDGEPRHNIGVTAHLEARAGEPIATVDGPNYVYVDPQIGVGDSPTINVYDSDSGSADDELLIAILDAEDTDDDGVAESLTLAEQPNRGPVEEPETIAPPRGTVGVAGAIATGPREAPPDRANHMVINLPVTDSLAAGDSVGYHLDLDEDRALTIEGEADGTGGLQQAFVRTNFALGLGDTNRQTLSGDLTLTGANAQVQFIDPGGASRNVDLPPEANSLVYIIANTADAAEDLTIRDDAGNTLATVNQDDIAYAISDGNGWAVFAAPGGAT